MRQAMGFAGVAAAILLAGALAASSATAPPWLRTAAAEPGVPEIYGLMACGLERIEEQLRSDEVGTALKEAEGLVEEWWRSDRTVRKATMHLASVAHYRRALALHRLGRDGESLAALLGALRFDRDVGVLTPPWKVDVRLFTECVVLIANLLKGSAGLEAAPQLLRFFEYQPGSFDLLAADLEGNGAESFVGVLRSECASSFGGEYAAWVVVCRRGPDGAFAGQGAALREANRHLLAKRQEPDGSTSVVLCRKARSGSGPARRGEWHLAPELSAFVREGAPGAPAKAAPAAAREPAPERPEPKPPEALSAAAGRAASS